MALLVSESQIWMRSVILVLSYDHKFDLFTRGFWKDILNYLNNIELGEYEWKTYSQVHSDADAMANYLLTRDLVPKRDTEEG
jgi:hypothetical protein